MKEHQHRLKKIRKDAFQIELKVKIGKKRTNRKKNIIATQTWKNVSKRESIKILREIKRFRIV